MDDVYYVEVPERHIRLRQFCTCPRCQVVWDHPETPHLARDWAWARERYGGMVRCPYCGAESAPQTPENCPLPKRLKTSDRRMLRENIPRGAPGALDPGRRLSRHFPQVAEDTRAVEEAER